MLIKVTDLGIRGGECPTPAYINPRYVQDVKYYYGGGDWVVSLGYNKALRLSTADLNKVLEAANGKGCDLEPGEDEDKE